MTKWNPSGLTSNCGFCAISYALEEQKRVLINADQLYNLTLHRLGIERIGNADPIPRGLLFPVKGEYGRMNLPVAYQALQDRAIGPSDYTIASVAGHAGLRLESGNRVMLNAMLRFGSESRPPLTLEGFVRARMEIPQVAAKSNVRTMKAFVERELRGTSIVGSVDGQHFVNLIVGPTGSATIFDPQIGSEYDARHCLDKLGEVALFERVHVRPPV